MRVDELTPTQLRQLRAGQGSARQPANPSGAKAAARANNGESFGLTAKGPEAPDGDAYRCHDCGQEWDRWGKAVQDHGHARIDLIFEAAS